VIVVDTSVLMNLTLSAEQSANAMVLLNIDAHWYAPYLWRSEFRNAIALYMRHRSLSIGEAREAVRTAEDQMFGHEYFVDPMAVLDLVAASTCTAYDCEFVALAQEMRAPLVTTDKQILRDFPQIARPLDGYR
jgi:predicted nucleic acid-binding protein